MPHCPLRALEGAEGLFKNQQHLLLYAAVLLLSCSLRCDLSSLDSLLKLISTLTFTQ